MLDEDRLRDPHEDPRRDHPGVHGEYRSVTGLMSDLIADASTLFRQEIRLAQAEGTQKITQAVLGLVAIVGGLLVATCALLVLLQALVIALSEYMAPALAALVVGVVVALIAFVMIWQGKRNLSADKLMPQRTMQSLRDDKDMVMEKAR
jgi:putative superfamily III holin-X